MNFENVALHNVDGLYKHKDIEGLLLGRVPEHVSARLSKAGQMMMICPSGSEIRFVSETYPVKITLSVDKITKHLGDGIITDARVFFGTFQTRQRFVIKRTKTLLEIIRPPKFIELAEKIATDAPFSPHVCRIRFWGTTMGAPIRFHGIETEGKIRPPHAEELPGLSYLAYGTSLTQGAYASESHLSYPNLVGCRLDADVINLGSSCSAYCEPEMADYIAGRKDWNFATLDLSLNMVDTFSPEEFSRRVSYMINRIAGSNKSRPVFCITLKPYLGDYIESKKPDLYRKLLRKAVENSALDNLYLIEGQDLMPDVAGGLCPDMVHLGDFGTIQIAEKLAAKIKPVLQSHHLLFKHSR